MTFQVSIGLASDPGQRTVNEDFVGVSIPERKTLAEKGLIGVVADGVSSAGAGRVASRMAVRGLISDYLSTPATWDVSVALDRVLGALNDWLWAQNERADERTRMVTTLTAIVIRGRRFSVAHIGDSRAMLVRDGAIVQLTREHSRHDGVRDVLTRALGLDSKILVDYSDGDLQIGDCFILSTDGAHGHTNDPRLVHVAVEAGQGQQAAQTMADRIIGIAIGNKTSDNASVLVLRVDGLAADTLGDISHRMAHLPAPPQLRIGSTLDGFVIAALVRKSSAHLLYQARDADGSLVAIKTLHPARAGNPDEVAALAYEDWITAQLHGGNFAERIGVGPRQTMNYLVYRWYGGTTLENRIGTDTRSTALLAIDEVIDLARQVAQGIGQLHRRGIVHRDIKPDNLMLCDDGVVRILDLGVAASGYEPDSVRECVLEARAGTPSYMNPEQWKGAQADARSDLFAIGVVMYRALAGKLPFGDVEPYQLARYRHDPTSLARIRPDVPIWLDRLVLRAIALDPKQRFETAEEFLLALDRGASRLLNAPLPTPLIARDPATLWRIIAAMSVLVNMLLVYFLLALPH